MRFGPQPAAGALSTYKKFDRHKHNFHDRNNKRIKIVDTRGFRVWEEEEEELIKAVRSRNWLCRDYLPTIKSMVFRPKSSRFELKSLTFGPNSSWFRPKSCRFLSNKIFDNSTNVLGILTKIYDISTIIFEILTNMFEIWTKIFQIRTNIFENSTKSFEISLTNQLNINGFGQNIKNLGQNLEHLWTNFKHLEHISSILVKIT